LNPVQSGRQTSRQQWIAFGLDLRGSTIGANCELNDNRTRDTVAKRL
jgi:hypothetical protein